MTTKAISLLSEFEACCVHGGVCVRARQQLVAYIEELESKAQLLDGWQRFERLEHERLGTRQTHAERLCLKHSP